MKASAALLVLFGCAAEAPLAANDPANAKARVAAESEPANVLAKGFDADALAPQVDQGEDPHAHHHHGASAPPGEPVIYSCAHHPEVQSDKPGECPKCGMDLTPKKPKPASPSPHEGH